jgi:hypothetical protein
MKTDLLIYRPGVDEPESVSVEMAEEPTYSQISDQITPILKTNRIEHVAVLFNGKRADMFVDECGAIGLRNREPLPINEAATKIYHAASRRRGADMTDAAKIHGVAVVVANRIIWN